MRPSFSSTTKSLTFSQISASVRGSKVPSLEYAEISSWICFASGKMALRVRMDFSAQSIDFFPRRGNRLLHPGWRRTACNIMHRQYGCRLQAILKALIECRIQCSQLLECEFLELAIPFHAQFHCFTDLLVSEPGGNAAIN